MQQWWEQLLEAARTIFHSEMAPWNDETLQTCSAKDHRPQSELVKWKHLNEIIDCERTVHGSY